MESKVSKEEYEIGHWGRFDTSTLMPFPEKTQSQELLDKPIPLENRINHLLPYIEPDPIRRTAFAIAHKMGVPISWVKKTAKHIGLQSSIEENLDGEQIELFQYMAYELLDEEKAWSDAYEELDDFLSSYAVGNFIARTPYWVRVNASDLEIHPILMPLASGRDTPAYPKHLVLQLRHLLLLTPAAENRLTIHALSELTGDRPINIDRKLKALGVESDNRRSMHSGQIARHFQYKTLSLLEERKQKQPPPAADWMTAKTIGKLLNKSQVWVAGRINNSFQQLGEVRLTDGVAPYVHYPPLVYEALKAEVKELALIPVAEDTDLAMSALVKVVGRNEKWITDRIPYTDIQATRKINPVNGRLFNYFQQSDSDSLLGLPDNILDKLVI